MTHLIKTILIASIFIVGTSASTAQSVVPGFRGKRLFVEGNFSCLPFVVAGPTAENTGSNHFYNKEKGSFFNLNAFSWRTGGTIHYITERKSSLFLGFEHFNTGLLSTAYTKSVLQRKLINTDDIDKHYLFSTLNINVIQAGIELNSGQGMLAPMGPYTRWSAQYYSISSNILDKYTEYAHNQDGSLGNRPLGIDNASTWDLGIGLEFGSRMMIAKNTMLTLGIRSNWALTSLFQQRYVSPDGSTIIDLGEESILKYIKENKSDNLNQYLFTNAARTRNSAHSIFMLNIGVSYLIK
jgi:hypothetical protein